MTTEEVQKLDKELIELYHLYLDGTQIADVKNTLLEKWGKVRNNEKILSVALKGLFVENYEKASFVAPGIAGLTILDYKNVDPIAYDVVYSYILDNDYKVAKINNPLFKDLTIPYIASYLINKDLQFSINEKNKIIYQICQLKEYKTSLYLAYIHPSFNKDKIRDENSYYFYQMRNEILTNYQERAKIKKLTTLPF